MSYCCCFSCGEMVSAFQKYCSYCIGAYHLPDEPKFQMVGLPNNGSYDEQRLKILSDDLKKSIQRIDNLKNPLKQFIKK